MIDDLQVDPPVSNIAKAAIKTEVQLYDITTLPPQESPEDTSNWDERSFTTPVGRVIIETNQPGQGTTVIGE